MAVYRPTYRDQKTGKLKQSAVWWFNFTYCGQRCCESAKTTRKTIAVEAEKRRRLELENARAGIPAEDPRQRIRRVADLLKAYQKAYSVNHRRKSIAVVRERSVHVERLLGACLPPDLTPERVIDYMARRREEGAGNRTINLDLLVLSRAIGQTWKTLWPKVKKLEENRDVGRALEPEEEAAILQAASRNASRLLYPFVVTLTWTGMRSDEARTLRWTQVDFEGGQITVGRAKTAKGTGRQIPMSSGGTLRAALEHHAAWYASRFGPIQPAWYVFPFSNRRAPVDPTRPVTSLKKAWGSIREQAGVSCRLHDLRHSFCTKMAEAGVPEITMCDIMGHVSKAMLQRYSHIRAAARREAIAAIETRAVSVGVPQVSAKVAGFEAGTSLVTH